jgi:starch synthase
MRTLFCTSEIYPYLKTGGLGDVAAALPSALVKADVDVRFFLPGYKNILSALQKPETLISFPIYFGAHDVRIIKGVMPEGLVAYVLDAPDFWDRGGIYVDAKGADWPDNHFRFAAFARAAADLADYDPEWKAEIIHGNDWHCGLIPAYIKLRSGPPPFTILTIHNIAYQGLFPSNILPMIGLPEEMYKIDGVEFYNKIGYLKAGLAYSDHITTVSPTYAREIQHSEQGCGLQDFLRTRSSFITGILNGIDTNIWSPERDKDIFTPYNQNTLEKRAENKRALLKKYKLVLSEDKPLFAVISRLGYQKGFDLLLKAVPRILEQGGKMLVLGSGDKELEDSFTNLASTYPDKIAVHIGYDEKLAHQIQAGADVIAIPSRSEPCGLVQLYAMRYGALPFVRRTGGLADTVIDVAFENATGFVFEGEKILALIEKIDQIFETYADAGKWASLQKRGMAGDYSWAIPASEYKNLYMSLLKRLSGNPATSISAIKI